MNYLPCFFALSAVACTADGEGAAGDGATLPNDAYFIASFAPYGSPEACLANSPEPRGCRFAITLCKDGRAARRIADIVSVGTYDLDGSIAHATLADGTSFEFDVETRVKTGDSPNTTWIVDTNNTHMTQQFDSIDCSR